MKDNNQPNLQNMKANEFRLGNLVYYHIEDSMDERKEWDEVSPIDYDDLRILTEFKDNPEYKPIPLAEEWLLKFGFLQNGSPENMFFWHSWGTNGVQIVKFSEYYKKFTFELGSGLTKVLDHVHQLQNLYFALTGEELKTK